MGKTASMSDESGEAGGAGILAAKAGRREQIYDDTQNRALAAGTVTMVMEVF